MHYRTYLLVGTAAFVLAACGNSGATSDASSSAAETVDLHEKLRNVSAASYSLERSHAFLSFKVSHGYGISSYRIAFTDFDAALDFDPADPEASQLEVTVNPLAVEANYPGDYKAGNPDSVFETWNEDISHDAKWLNGDAHPDIRFASTHVQRGGDDTGTVTGDLTFLGQTQPITLDVTFNGAANAPWFGERDLIGFDATTTLTRSEWGMAAYLPLVGDNVTVNFSGEFLQDE